MSRLGVVFVNFHSEGQISPRAEVLTAAGLAVVVADNSGTCPDMALPVVAMERNAGFAAGCNAGVRLLPPDVDVVLFHNPDVTVAPSAIRRLAAELLKQPRPGAISPAESCRGRVRRSGYAYPSPAREALLARRAVRSGDGCGPSRDASAGGSGPSRLSRLGVGRRFGSGGSLLVSRSAHDSIGGFDERYPLYAEDLDYWHRLGLAGWSTGFAPGVEVDHPSGTGSVMGSLQRELLRWLGVELFAERFAGAGWRPYRLAHRPFLAAVAPAWPEGVAAVDRLWARGARPSDVVAAVRPFFESPNVPGPPTPAGMPRASSVSAR